MSHHCPDGVCTKGSRTHNSQSPLSRFLVPPGEWRLPSVTRTCPHSPSSVFPPERTIQAYMPKLLASCHQKQAKWPSGSIKTSLKPNGVCKSNREDSGSISSMRLRRVTLEMMKTPATKAETRAFFLSAFTRSFGLLGSNSPHFSMKEEERRWWLEEGC